MADRSSDDATSSDRLRRCIRDLAALQALPSMCIGRTPAEALEVILEAVPAALGCEAMHLSVPGAPPVERAIVHGRAAEGERLAAIGKTASALDAEGGGPAWVDVAGMGSTSAICARAHVTGGDVRLFVGRMRELDRETDALLVRVATNLVASALETARVLEAARRKDEFLAVLGHELRNPLAPILTAVEVLARVPAAQREQRIIERHTRHLARLVDDLLDISRVTRGSLELRKEPVPLDSVVERACEIAGPLIARNKHRFEVDLTTRAVVEADPVRLAQVFANLLTNAAKFTPHGGNIRVKVERAGDRVRVVVRDDGRGIARDQLQRIFEPFVQADRERDALSGGLGLGLAIVKNLAEHHGGTITAESEGPGRGSAFTVDLPTVDPLPRAEVGTSNEPTPEREGVRVLVVDDNVDVAELLSEALAVEGFTTAVAHDATGALEIGRSFAPHAAVLDVGLPEMDGYDLARLLRQEHGQAVTLIAATGYGQQRDRDRAKAAGFACHLVKPVSVRDLVAALDNHVAARATR